MKKLLHYIFPLLLLFQVGIFYAQFEIPPKPQGIEQTSVYDYANLLCLEDKKALEQKLINYADSTSNQIVIAIIPSLKGEYEGTLAPSWAHKWGIGQKGKDNGVFILLAEQERKLWIAPGYGLEHLLTAGVNGQIIRNEIIPYFKQGDYYGGLDNGTDQLIALFSGQYIVEEGSDEGANAGLITLLLMIGVIALLVYWSNKQNKKKIKKYKDAGLSMEDIMIILSRAGRNNKSGGWKGGGFGGGGFGGGFSGGFGGGGFSGGGAGGSW